jgi:hypothetical protein
VTTSGQLSVCSIPLGNRSDRVLDSFPYLIGADIRFDREFDRNKHSIGPDIDTIGPSIRANIRFDREIDRNEHLIGPDIRSERTLDRIKHPIRLRIESEWKFVWTRNSIG